MHRSSKKKLSEIVVLPLINSLKKMQTQRNCCVKTRLHKTVLHVQKNYRQIIVMGSYSMHIAHAFLTIIISAWKKKLKTHQIKSTEVEGNPQFIYPKKKQAFK